MRVAALIIAAAVALSAQCFAVCAAAPCTQPATASHCHKHSKPGVCSHAHVWTAAPQAAPVAVHAAARWHAVVPVVFDAQPQFSSPADAARGSPPGPPVLRI